MQHGKWEVMSIHDKQSIRSLTLQQYSKCQLKSGYIPCFAKGVIVPMLLIVETPLPLIVNQTTSKKINPTTITYISLALEMSIPTTNKHTLLHRLSSTALLPTK
jgi:hypothetical protein